MFVLCLISTYLKELSSWQIGFGRAFLFVQRDKGGLQFALDSPIPYKVFSATITCVITAHNLDA